MFRSELDAASLPARRFIVACVRPFLLVGVVGFLLGSAPPEASDETEYERKARYLHNFLHFTEWPSSSFESDTSPLILGVIGEDPFGRMLDKAVGSSRLANHPVIVRRYRTVFHLEDCHVLFISSSEQENVDAILDLTLKRPVLVVSDMDGVTDRGGMINFFESQNRLQFEIQLGTAQLFGLRIDPRLLRLARVRRPLPEPLIKRLKEAQES